MVKKLMKTAHKVIYDQGVSVFYRLENTSSVFLDIWIFR